LTGNLPWRSRLVPKSADYGLRRGPARVDVWRMIGFMPAVGELVRCTDGSSDDAATRRAALPETG
jgi:hypothetical protein